MRVNIVLKISNLQDCVESAAKAYFVPCSLLWFFWKIPFDFGKPHAENRHNTFSRFNIIAMFAMLPCLLFIYLVPFMQMTWRGCQIFCLMNKFFQSLVPPVISEKLYFCLINVGVD